MVARVVRCELCGCPACGVRRRRRLVAGVVLRLCGLCAYGSEVAR
jgi:hypothetical protein